METMTVTNEKTLQQGLNDVVINKVHKLVGVSGAIALIGVEMFNKLLKRAFSSVEDKCVCKLRRGIKFSFYIK